MKKLVFMIAVCAAMVGCNGGGTATNEGAASADSVGVGATEAVVETVDSEVVTNVEAVADSVEEEKDSHEYVDLGLESGTLWATCNIGAEKPEEYGEYYACGETETKAEYNEENNKWTKLKTDDIKSQGVIDENGNLTADYDVATVVWGKEWRMPTKEEIKELIDLPNENAEVNGVKGRKFTGSTGKTLFLPFAGSRDDEASFGVGEYSFYWSATADDGEWHAYILRAYSKGVVDMALEHRRYGQTVRPVKKKE